MFGGASCSVYGKGWLFLNLFVWKKCWGKAFRAALWKIFPLRVLEELCRDACVQLSPCREEEMEEWNNWELKCSNYLPSPADKGRDSSAWCFLLLPHLLWVILAWALHFAAHIGCRCVCCHLFILSGMRGSPWGWLSLLWCPLVACISHAVLCWSFQLWFFLCQYFSGYRSDREVLTAKPIFMVKTQRMCPWNKCTPF